MDTPTPAEKKARVDPRSGELEPSPSRVEGARLLANEADEELERTTTLEDGDVRQMAEDYVETRGSDDTANFKARVLDDVGRDDQAEEGATSDRSSAP